MSLDVPTLMIAGAFLALMSGTLLLFARFQYRDTAPVTWWAAAHFVNAAGIIGLALSGTPPQGWLCVLSFALLAQAPALVWSAARRLNGKKAPSIVVFGVPALILVAPFVSPLPVLVTVGTMASVSSVVFLFSAAWCLAFQAREPLLSRWPLAFLCVAHAVALVLTQAQQIPVQWVPFWLAPVFQVIHFEALVYLLGTTIFLVAWMRESSEMRHKTAADTDMLTGVASRRAFFDTAERILERCQFAETPCTVIVFDLDHFKAINDTHGHETGDRVLKLFADVAKRMLRPHDVLGRIGGEEFAAVAGSAGVEAGVALADRVRRAFCEAAETLDGLAINGTVSAGVSGDVAGDDLGTILKRADTALYAAKLHGRNRVETAGPAGSDDTNVVRVA